VESGLFFGGSIVAAVIAGMIALFAPCCISFMLPAYFASAFQNRQRLVAMTFLFGAGVATVILPIALGASLLRQVFTDWHPYIYMAGGALLLGLAVFTLLGGQIHLPTPGRRAGGKAGPLSVYSLGVFSGITSSCCAPVLAAVIALVSVAPTFVSALGLGVAYVFGMVAPLFVISLLWERYDWRSSKLLRPRSLTWRIGSLQRTLSGSQLASGLLLLVLGVAMFWNGLTLKSMYRLKGWQANLAYELQHIGAEITHALSWIPNWLAIAVVLGALLLLARRALWQTTATEPVARDIGAKGDRRTLRTVRVVRAIQTVRDTPGMPGQKANCHSSDLVGLEKSDVR
jgi:cytochrome c biogenesis protein CcdA